MAAKKSRQQAEREKMIAAMTPLCALPEFETFMETVREMKDGAVLYMVNHTCVSNERESLVAKGEVRAFLWMLETYEGQKENLAAQIQAQQEQQAQAHD